MGHKSVCWAARIDRLRGSVALSFPLAAIGALCAMIYQGQCTNPGPPVDQPSTGTARAEACAGLPPSWGWLVLVVVPAVVVAAVAYRQGFERRTTLALAAVLVLGQMAFPIWVGTLEFAYTI
jgi:hypothetical protein